jgi:imidazole glycerol-phosphate synthase subunit HisH
MVTIVDSGIANVGSIANMLRKIGCIPTISSDPEVVAESAKLILPGVGAYDRGAERLRECGLDEALGVAARKEAAILGICLGMQLLGVSSEEGSRRGLGWLEAKAVRFLSSEQPGQPRLRVPHMGWNTLVERNESPLFFGLASDARFYFVHSYHLVPADESSVLARTSYGTPFVSAVQVGRTFGVQFHPEKSHRFGLQLLRNFVDRI